MAAESKSKRRTRGGRSSAGGRTREQASGGRRHAAAGGRKAGTTKRATAGSRKGSAMPAASRRAGAKGAPRRGADGSGARRSTSKATSAAARASRARLPRMDALALLKDDHERVDAMLRKFERMKDGDARKQALLAQILEDVRVHAQVEEELFYPALRAALEDDDKDKELKLIAEADTEHETVKWLMSELRGGQSDGLMADARVKVMGEYIRHHVEEEEGPIFRAAKRSGVDLADLGRQIDARKRELAGETAQRGTGNGEPMMARGAAPPIA